MDNIIPFKAFLYMEDGAKVEVRRFNIDIMFYGKIRPLRSKVRDLFPLLKAKNFTLAWKDEDNDEVLMSSDEEVATMYQQSRDSVLKLIIRYTGGPRTDDDAGTSAAATARTDPQSIHQGVTCNSCGHAVVGFRYKCITCDDFDLCVRCVNIGEHLEHCVVRMPPVPYKPNIFGNSADLAAVAEEASAIAADLASSPIGAMTPRCNKTPKLNDAPKEKEEAAIEQPVASTLKQNLGNVPSTSGATKDPNEFTLQDLSELMDVIHAAKAEIASNARTCSSNGSVKAEEWTVIDNPNDEGKKDLLKEQLDGAQNKMDDELKPEAVEGTRRCIATTYPPLNTATAVLDPKEVALAAPEMPRNEDTPIVNEEEIRRRKDELTQEKRTKSEEMRNQEAEADSTASIDRSTPAPHIQAAVAFMESMGFSDQSEWLTQLLTDVEGNISSVLDIITPHEPCPK